MLKGFTIVLALLFFLASANAQGFSEKEEKALETILKFARSLCSDLPLVHKERRFELSGDARADLQGLLKRLAGLEIEGAADFLESMEKRAVLEEDLVEALSMNTECKRNIWNDLKVKIVNSSRNIQKERDKPEATYSTKPDSTNISELIEEFNHYCNRDSHEDGIHTFKAEYDWPDLTISERIEGDLNTKPSLRIIEFSIFHFSCRPNVKFYNQYDRVAYLGKIGPNLRIDCLLGKCIRKTISQISRNSGESVNTNLAGREISYHEREDVGLPTKGCVELVTRLID